MATTVHAHLTETTKIPQSETDRSSGLYGCSSSYAAGLPIKKKKSLLLLDDGCVKRQTPEGTLEKESEIKVIIYQDIAGMQISVSASLFRQRFLVCSSGYILCFEPAGCRRDKMMESGNKKNKKNLSESK